MRQQELEKKQQEMASIQKMLNEQTKKMEEIQAQEVQILKSLEDVCGTESLDITTISNSNGFLEVLGNEEKKQTRVIENTKNILNHKQIEVKDAYIKVKTLEKLKEKQEKEYYLSFEVKEAKEIDDIVTTRYKAG